MNFFNDLMCTYFKLVFVNQCSHENYVMTPHFMPREYVFLPTHLCLPIYFSDIYVYIKKDTDKYEIGCVKYSCD